ncbi:MAG TPA: T9SS type A sorting domain-containing protein, partial [Ignavibacteriaceae bacterium]|nr:T9SS type A sorting domain-containing protein [Ignavibacteriaceae bacterium]
GNGTTTSKKEYSFVDKNVGQGSYSYRLKQIDLNGHYTFSNIVEINTELPREFNLAQNYPNPFNPSTKINFSLAVDSKIKLTIYNLLGQVVNTLINSNYTAGNHTVSFNANGLNSGIYFYKIEAFGIDGQNFVATRKMILTK